MKVTVVRKAHFNAAHRLYNSNWDEDKNYSVFGKCSWANYHGHNYELEVFVTGEIDPDTGYVINLDTLKTYIKEEVEEPFDHKNLNLDCKEFKSLNPTVENIVQVIYNKLRLRLKKDLDLRVKLYETPRNFAIFPALN